MRLHLRAVGAAVVFLAFAACGDSGGSGGGGSPASGGAPQGGQSTGGSQGDGGAGAAPNGGAGGAAIGGGGALGGAAASGGAGGGLNVCVDNTDCDPGLECCTGAKTPTCYDPACLACCMPNGN